MDEKKRCTHRGYLTDCCHKILCSTTEYICGYAGYCDYQLPRDSRFEKPEMKIDYGNTTLKYMDSNLED